jgi:ectoine hydroxylase-related dioxygenase (phytanoyl-CoA dioxygenase family)
VRAAIQSSERERDFSRDGFELRRGVLSDEGVAALLSELSAITNRSANRRSLLRDCPAVAELAASPPLQTIASEALGGDAFAVRALLFDKLNGANWGVPWHQDLAIAVEEKRHVPGFGGWSVKDGIPHVLPPVEVLAQMGTLRLHLDDCGAENGPLRVLPGSHRAGKLGDADIARWRAGRPEFVCTAGRGDLLVMRPLLLHASSAAQSPGHRRVLHIEYGAQPLPGGLRWAGQRVKK